MRWQRIAQVAIVIFVVGFIAVLIGAMRREKPPPPPQVQLQPLPGKDVQLVNRGPAKYSWFANGKKVFDLEAGNHVALADGRQMMSGGVRVNTVRNGKTLTINAKDAEFKAKGSDFESGVFKGDVWLSGEGGIDVRANEATYTEAEGLVRIPGAVAFRKGRLKGNGVGATYDMNREVLWLLEKATATVAPDRAGKGALDASAEAIGLAKADHYFKLTRAARITGEGRDIRADEITVTLTEDDERVQMMQLRGNSSMRGGAGGPQSMSAKDIDVMYADDGETLQNANLMERAVVQLAPPAGARPGTAGKRISGNAINIAMGPDGKTVTHLTATENAQVDLPAEGTAPAKRIRSAALIAIGAPETGLRNANFTGKVEYRETRAAARRGGPPAERTARSESMQLDTKPGLGAIEKADFRGNVHFTDGDATADAPRAIYHVERDRLELQSSKEDPGLPPQVKDPKITVTANTIDFAIGTRDLVATTKVKSTLTPTKSARGESSKVPSVLKQGEPVYVSANRLQYQSAASRAVYTGTATMWQDGDASTIKAETLTLDDKTGNLEATTNVVTDFLLEEVDAKTKDKKRTPTSGKADAFVFEDSKRLATYTGNAQFNSGAGNLTGSKIEVFLKKDANQVEKLEAYANGGVVRVKELRREAIGTHLTYTADNETYLMVGTPVKIIEEIENGEGWCNVGTGGSARFRRGQQSGDLNGVGKFQSETTREKCASVKR